jgi:UDP-glucose 4-epimerase
MTEIMVRDAGAAHGLRYMVPRYFNVAGADPVSRAGSRPERPPISSRSQSRLRSNCDRKWLSSEPTTRHGTVPASGIIFTFPISSPPHSDALAYLRGGGASTTLNCGYGRGFSVLDVIETVKRVSGVDFKVEFAARRAGDPAHLVAACDRIRSRRSNGSRVMIDLQTIITRALAWERTL